jgi:hypothetical protein
VKPKRKKKSVRLRPIDLLQRYDVVEAAQYLRISRAKLYNDVAAGLIAVIKDGKRTFVHGSELARRSAPPSAAAAA